MIDLAKSTMVQLKDEFMSLAVQLDGIDRQRKLIWAEIQRRKAAAFAKAQVKQLDAGEREALKEALQ